MKRFDGPWVEKRLGEVFSISGCNTFSRDQLSSEGNVKNVHYGDVLIKFDTYIDASNDDLPFIDTSIRTVAKNPLCNGDLVMADTAEDETVGKVCEIGNIGENQVEAGLHTVVLRPKMEFAPRFLGYFMNSSLYHDQLYPYMQGIKVLSITKAALGSTSIRIPPLPEQCAIARVLSDMDGLIGSTERLIEKKKAVKNALLHDLLSGKRRLNGFTDTWEERKLGEVCEIRSGGTPKTNDVAFWNGKILWCTPTDITANNDIYISSTARTISELGVTHGANGILPAGTLLVCSRATIGELKIAACPITTNQGFKNLICNEKVNNLFLYYKLQTMKQELISRASGSTFLEISKTKIEIIPFLLPSLPEQHAIAEVLSDADNEIVALERKVEKLRSVKAGMMGKLLTGEIRLPSEV